MSSRNRDLFEYTERDIRVLSIAAQWQHRQIPEDIAMIIFGFQSRSTWRNHRDRFNQYLHQDSTERHRIYDREKISNA